ncbi:unnamed protein product [Vicia faba]|uniref:Amidohydrolase-related domain-containing protein n=1 Tax=Vicia faba TaxID=3906 RepID=A0AAV1A468_VICFA|nr:unnamed protein product [Vicia faba]
MAIILAASSAVLALLLVTATMGFFIRKNVMRKRRERKQFGTLLDTVNKSKLNVPYEILEKATNYFNDDNKLGQGGSGSVYKGVMPDGNTVAVKRLSFNSTQWVDHFFNEVNLISGVHHKNDERRKNTYTSESLRQRFNRDSALRYHLKKIRDQKIIPRLRLSRAGHPPKLERFSHYVARQMGFKDRRIGPDICRLASEYISKYEGFEDDIYSYFENEPDADSLYVKLVEEFERCILSYFGFHWNHCDILISQVLSSDISEPKKKLKNIVMESYPIAGEIVGLKSIAAYYFGLDINTNVTKMEAEEALQQVLSVWKPVLVANKNLVDYIFLISLEFAQSHDLPMQIHTGFGDRGLNLRMSNPLYLHNILEDKRFAKCRIVLLHTSYPFSKEASYLASLYSQVYLDFGLAIPKLSVHGMVSAVKDLLEQAPLNKVMFSTDAYAFPKLFYLGAKNARKVVFTVLRDSCIDGDLTVSEAVEAAKDLFARNSINFYKIIS